MTKFLSANFSLFNCLILVLNVYKFCLYKSKDEENKIG